MMAPEPFDRHRESDGPTESAALAYLTTQQDRTPWNLRELEDERTVFGRHPSSHIVLDNEAVSRHHAQILQSHGHYFLEDLKSRNGTLVNGRLVDQPTELHENDAITLCDFEFRFHQDRPDPSPPPQPAPLEHDSENSRYFAVGVEPVDDDGSSSSILSKLSMSTIRRDHVAADPEAKLQAVLEISKSLGQVLEFDEVLTRMLDGLFEIFPQAEEGFVLLKEDKSANPVIRATRNRSDTPDRTPSISLTIVREAMSSGEAILSA
ncbi:MAG: FHA domain-containing protein, partial [Planctomycetota bacterium]|nr:FHA domain-containing protein [Planctomycetota bacterium]